MSPNSQLANHSRPKLSGSLDSTRFLDRTRPHNDSLGIGQYLAKFAQGANLCPRWDKLARLETVSQTKCEIEIGRGQGVGLDEPAAMPSGSFGRPHTLGVGDRVT